MTDLTGLHADMTNEDYHSQTDWASSSSLKALLPERYKAGGSQEALDFGTLFHTAVLEPDNLAAYTALDAAKIAGDNPKTGKPYDAPQMTSRYKAAVAEAEAGGANVIPQEWLDRALAMAEAIREHDTAANLLHGIDGAFEESAFAEVDGVPCRARFDKRIPGAILDLKSTSAKPGPDSLTRAILDYGYDLSAAHYLKVAQALGLDVETFALVFVSKTPNEQTGRYYVTVIDLDETFLTRGRALRAQAVDRLMHRAEPYAGASGFLTLPCPKWAQLTEEIAS